MESYNIIGLLVFLRIVLNYLGFTKYLCSEFYSFEVGFIFVGVYRLGVV